MKKIDLSAVSVRDNREAKRFEAEAGGHLAVVEYIRAGSKIVFTHTEVPRALEGQGLGDKLVRAALDGARAEGLAVVPLCPFVKAFIQRHADAYLDLVA